MQINLVAGYLQSKFQATSCDSLVYVDELLFLLSRYHVPWNEAKGCDYLISHSSMYKVFYEMQDDSIIY